MEATAVLTARSLAEAIAAAVHAAVALTGASAGAFRSAEAEAEAAPSGAAVLVIPVRHGTEVLGTLELVGGRIGNDGALDAISAALAAALRIDRAERDLRRRDELFAMAVHELKTPITSLLLHLQRTRRQLGPPVPGAEPPYRDAIRTCERQCRRLALLSDAVLGFAAVQLGRIRLQPEEVDIAILVQDTAVRFRLDAEDAGSALSVLVDGPLVAHADPARVEQALACLVANAIKFGAGRPVELRAGRNASGAIELSVADLGAGIEPEAQRTLFRRFERPAPQRGLSGLGLGLYLAREIMMAHGGHVTVESIPGRGSVFRLVLPPVFSPEHDGPRAPATLEERTATYG